MSKPDKHTPLSPDELFKLLEDNSGKATDFDGMDDFEKEALEGFTNYSSPEKAVAMVEELNLLVSKKAAQGSDKLGIAAKSEASGNTKKNKVIWFSAAASIVLLIVVSVFFLNESKKDMASNVAALEQTAPPTMQPTIVAPDETISAAEPLDEKSKAAGQGTFGKMEGKEASKQDLADRLAADDAKPGSGVSQEIALAETKTQEESEIANATNANVFTYNKVNIDTKDLDLLKKSENEFKKNEFESGDKLAAKPAVNTRNVSETVNGYVMTSTGSNNNTTAAPSIDQNAKYDARLADEKSTANKAAKEVAEERAEKSGKAKEKAPAYKTIDSEMDQDVLSAYYKGGELDIKEYVVSYLQKKGTPVTGKYKVKANVMTNGTLKVKFVNHITNEVCKDCENILKKALSEMTGWTPAMWGKTASESSVDFVLSF